MRFNLMVKLIKVASKFQDSKKLPLNKLLRELGDAEVLFQNNYFII